MGSILKTGLRRRIIDNKMGGIYVEKIINDCTLQSKKNLKYEKIDSIWKSLRDVASDFKGLRRQCSRHRRSMSRIFERVLT